MRVNLKEHQVFVYYSVFQPLPFVCPSDVVALRKRYWVWQDPLCVPSTVLIRVPNRGFS